MKFVASRLLQADLSVRSALMQWILVEVLRTGEGGSIMSVRVREAIEASLRRAVARAWPRKPPAPVMRMFAMLTGFDRC